MFCVVCADVGIIILKLNCHGNKVIACGIINEGKFTMEPWINLVWLARPSQLRVTWAILENGITRGR